MGDKANVVVKFENNQYVWFYTHWGGWSIPRSVQKALQRKERWGDDAYLARIIFCTVCPESTHNDETGFGISASMCDNEYRVVLVNTVEQTVSFHTESRARKNDFTEPLLSFSFDEYCKIDADWEALFPGDGLGRG